MEEIAKKTGGTPPSPANAGTHILSLAGSPAEPISPTAVTPTGRGATGSVGSPSATRTGALAFGTPHSAPRFSSNSLFISSPSVLSPTAGTSSSFAFAVNELASPASGNTMRSGSRNPLLTPSQASIANDQTIYSLASPTRIDLPRGSSLSPIEEKLPVTGINNAQPILDDANILTIARPIPAIQPPENLIPRSIANLGKAGAYLVNCEISAPIFPDSEKRAPGCLDRVRNFLRSWLRPSQKARKLSVQFLSIALQGVTLYFWINENAAPATNASRQNLAFITLANGFLIRANLGLFAKGHPVAAAIDRIIQTFTFPIVMAEQGVVTALYDGDWLSPAAEAFVIGLAGSFIGMRAARLYSGFLDNELPSLRAEIDYLAGQVMLPIGETLRHAAPTLLLASALITTDLLLEDKLTPHSLEKVSVNIVGQFGLAIATASLVKLSLERSPYFRRQFTVNRARACSSLVVNFFPLAIRPGESVFYGTLLGVIIAIDSLAKERVLRHQNYMFAGDSKIVAWLDENTDFRAKLQKAITDFTAELSLARKILLAAEGEPISIIPASKKKAAAIAAFPIAAGLAAIQYEAAQTFALILTPAFYLITRHVQLSPKEYARLCKKERANSLDRSEKLRLIADRYLCKNPSLIGMAYAAAGKAWKITSIDAPSFVTFCIMAGIFYATENRLAYNSPATLAMLEEASQQAYLNMDPAEAALVFGSNEAARRHIEASLRIKTGQESSAKTNASGISLSYQQALCLQQQLPSIRAVETNGFFASPPVTVVPSPPLYNNPIQAAAISGCYGADFSTAALGGQ
jgi:hypothetical protein